MQGEEGANAGTLPVVVAVADVDGTKHGEEEEEEEEEEEVGAVVVEDGGRGGCLAMTSAAAELG